MDRDHIDVKEQQRRRELEQRRDDEEEKGPAVERTPDERPLEGFSAAHTTWTGEQDDARAPFVHGNDEAASRERPEEQVGRTPKT